MHEKPDLKVFIEILNANLQLVLVKYQFLGATLYLFLNIMYL